MVPTPHQRPVHRQPQGEHCRDGYDDHTNNLDGDKYTGGDDHCKDNQTGNYKNRSKDNQSKDFTTKAKLTTTKATTAQAKTTTKAATTTTTMVAIHSEDTLFAETTQKARQKIGNQENQQ